MMERSPEILQGGPGVGPESAIGRGGTLRRRTDRIVGGMVIAIFVVLIADVLWQVVARFVPIPIPAGLTSFTEELARSLLLWLTILGAAHAAGTRSHLAIDLISRRLRPRRRRLYESAVECVVGLFAVLILVVGGAALVRLTLALEQVAASLRIPMGVIYLILPIGGLVMAWYTGLNVAERIGHVRAGPDADGSDSPGSAMGRGVVSGGTEGGG